MRRAAAFCFRFGSSSSGGLAGAAGCPCRPPRPKSPFDCFTMPAPDPVPISPCSKVFTELREQGVVSPAPEFSPPEVPMDLGAAKKAGKVGAPGAAFEPACLCARCSVWKARRGGGRERSCGRPAARRLAASPLPPPSPPSAAPQPLAAPSVFLATCAPKSRCARPRTSCPPSAMTAGRSPPTAASP